MIDDILDAMGMSGAAAEVQRAQTAHRLRLIDIWRIAPGSRVLEIGCGQGDTLAALACAVGEGGFVHGVDIAGADYGCPETLGQARARLLGGALGGRIRMDFDTDVLSGDAAFGAGEFDCVVLSHCLWYMPGAGVLEAILRRVRPWCGRLCVAEWSADVRTAAQMPHYTAALVQAMCMAYSRDERMNVGSLLYPAQIFGAIERSGWRVTRSQTIPSTGMQDGGWEVDNALSVCPDAIRANAAMPEAVKELLTAQLDELRRARAVEPLDTLCVCAE